MAKIASLEDMFGVSMTLAHVIMIFDGFRVSNIFSVIGRIQRGRSMSGFDLLTDLHLLILLLWHSVLYFNMQ